MPIDLRQQSAKLYGNRYPAHNNNPLGLHNRVGPVVPPSKATKQLKSDMGTLFGLMGSLPGGAGGNSYDVPPLSGMPGGPPSMSRPPAYPAARTINPTDLGAPTPAALYGSAVREHGLMTDQQAGQFYANNADPITGQRYMPRTTVGGAWGQRSGPHIGSQAVMNGGASADKVGGMQAATARLLENPDGRWFQGAAINPNANQYPGASTFIEPNRSTRTPEQAAGRFAMAANRAVARNPALSVSSTGALVGSPNPDFAPPTAEQLAENRANYQARRGVDLAARRQGVVQNAQARATARRDRMDGPSIDEALAMRDPRYGIALANLRAQQGSADADRQNALAVQQARNEGALGVAQAEAGTKQNEQRMAAGLRLIEAGETERGLAMIQGQGGVDLAQPSSQRGNLNQDQWQELAEAPEEEREQKLIAYGIADPAERARILREARGGKTPQRSMWDRLADSPLGWGAANLTVPGWIGQGLGRIMGSGGGMPELVTPANGPSDEELMDSPSDTPLQRRLKEQERQKRRAAGQGGQSVQPPQSDLSTPF